MNAPLPDYLPPEIRAKSLSTVNLRVRCASMYAFMRGVGYTPEELLFRYRLTQSGAIVGCEVVPVSLRDVYPAPTGIIAKGEQFARYSAERSDGGP